MGLTFTCVVQERFNAKLQCLMTLKSKHIEKIQEANNRTGEILELLNGLGKSLEGTEYIFQPYQDPSLEDPEEVLIIRDEDVKCEKYVSSEDLKKAQVR